MKNYINLNGKKIEISEETAKNLEEQFSEEEQDKKRVPPEEGDDYWCPNSCGDIVKINYRGDEVDRKHVRYGDYEHTKKEEEKKAKENEIIESIRRYCSDKFGYDPKGGWDDWADEEQVKYHLEYGHYSDRICFDCSFGCQKLTYCGYFKEKEHAQDIIKEFKDELKFLFNVG